jgi:mercuric ion transport protein
MNVPFWTLWKRRLIDMTLVEFVYEKNCPNIEPTRSILLQAFSKLKMKPHWMEWEISDVSTPGYVRRYGSPTILINGKDVGESENLAKPEQCRLYTQPDNSLSGVPSINIIMNAIQAAASGNKYKLTFNVTGLNVAALPAIIFALLPKLICPFCWPLYTGLLGSIGINFINYTPYLFPLLTLFLILTMSGLMLGAKSNKQYDPIFLGGLSSLLVLIGKFLYESEMCLYFGLIGLVASVIWQQRIKSSGNRDSCPDCK